VSNTPPDAGLGRRLFTNTLHAASGRLASMVVWILFTPAVLRTLGTERFAIWSLFYALTGYFAALDFGLMQGTLRGVSAARGRGDHGEAGAFATLALLGYGLLALLWMFIAVLAATPLLTWLHIPPALTNSARFAVTLGALVFMLSGVANVVMAVAQGYGRFDLANAVLLLMAAQQAVGMMLVLHFRWGLEGLLLNVAAGWLIGGGAGLVLLNSGIRAFRWSAPQQSLRRAREALRFGAPMQATNLLAVANAQMDKLLIARFVSLAAVTPFELGSRVATTVTSLPQLLLTPVLREAAWISDSGPPGRLRELFDRAGRYYLAVSALCVAPLLAAAPRLFSVWLGAPHRESALVLGWLAVAMGVTLATGMATAVARGMARTDLEALFAVVTVFLHFTLSVWLIPRMGLRGALVATLVSHTTGSLLFMIMFARAAGWPFFKVVLRPWLEPSIAVLLGWTCGAWVDGILPGVSGGAGWISVVAVASVAALAVLLFVIATRFVPWREARALLTARR
jgi:O-antigen/teichoic acid export membrane protein